MNNVITKYQKHKFCLSDVSKSSHTTGEPMHLEVCWYNSRSKWSGELLCTLEPTKLCNGAHLVVKKLMSQVIRAIILSGCGKDNDVFIPRILLTPSIVEISFPFRKLQFLLRVSFAMSINKSQVQILSVADLLLEEPCFCTNNCILAAQEWEANMIPKVKLGALFTMRCYNHKSLL